MKKATAYPDICPFYSNCDSVCLASISSMAVSDFKAIVKCKSEDHDNCPVFLSKILRRA